MTRNEHIKKYLSYGWCLVPVVKGEKRPAVNWKEYQDRKPTNEELQRWFSDPEVGVGLVTGKISGVTVIDEDSYKKNGDTSLNLSSPLVVNTGSGGRHLYFKYKEGTNNSVNADIAVDVRSQGGFVVLPPTLHPSEKNYEWATELPDMLNLPEFVEPEVGGWRKLGGGGEKVDMSEYLNIGKGSRDDSLLRAGLKLANKFTPEEVYPLLVAINNSYQPPLPQSDLDRIFRQATTFVDNHPKTTAETREAPSEDLRLMSFTESDNRYRELMKKFGEGVTTGFSTIDAYFKFIPTQLYVVAAATHVGKTTLILNMAARMAECDKKVVIASLEQNVFIVPLLQKLALTQEKLSNIQIVAPMTMPTPSNFIELFKDVKDKPDVLFVDHLHYFKRGTRGATEEIDRLMVELQMMANKLEIPVVVVSHLRKLNDRPVKGKSVMPAMDDLKDSSSLSQIPGVVLLLHRDRNKDEHVKLEDSYLSRRGTLIIAKNRVQGKTGFLSYYLDKKGQMLFDDEARMAIKKDEPTLYDKQPYYSGDGADQILDSD